MTSDYSKLVKALRCVEHEKLACPDCTERDCYANSGRGLWCRVPLLLEDAAAAIEALQARLPKRGKWIWDDKRCIYVCSVCGSPKVRENMDRQIIKEQAYCYSCGAKMMEVQDDD